MRRLICRAALRACVVASLLVATAQAEPFGDPIVSPENPSPGAHKKLLYNSDFTYITDSPELATDLGDALKQLEVGAWGTLDVGGQLRMQYNHEVGMAQGLGPATVRFQDYDTDHWLTRLRLLNNWKIDDSLRVFVEGHYAGTTSDDGNYVPRSFDANYGDFLNAFVDVSPWEGVTFRVGRQELIYGAERTMSVTNWQNSRRTFEGARMLTTFDNWSVDLFYTAFVPVSPTDLDEADWKMPFYGCYSTYTDSPGNLIDLYYIGYDNRHEGEPIATDFSLHTFGTRYLRTWDNGWLYEVETAAQFGRQSGLGLDHEAGFMTMGVGYKFDDLAWKPTLWGYYDYASGNAAGGSFNRYNHLFPWSHQFMGYIDAVQRSNIEAPNLLLTMKPTKRLELLFWYYYFFANQASDIVPAITSSTPQNLTSDEFGQELDFTGRYYIGPRSNILLGYSHFWRGAKITAPHDADFTYVQWEVNF